MTDSLWFLNDLLESEVEESKSEQNDLSESDQPNSNADFDELDNDTNILDDFNEEETATDSNWADVNPESENIQNKQSVEDFENSLFDLSTDKNNIRKINITVDSDNYRQFNTDVSPVGDSTLLDSKNVDDAKLFITVSTDDNKGTEYKDLQSKSGISENGNKTDENEKDQQKIYVILNDGKQTGVTNENITGNSGSNAKYYTEVGSTVINLNDYINPQGKEMSGNEIITTSVNPSGGKTDDGKSKVEVVITIKDQRKKSGKNSKSSKSKDSFNDPLDSLLKRNIKRNRNIWDKLDSSSNQTTWKTTTYSGRNNNKAQDEPEWSEETRDSFIRESDGARCTRTVWTTPQGRKVQTQCHKEANAGPRYRRFYERGSNNSNLSFNSIWRNLDNELDNLFTRANRMMYF